MHFKVVVFFNPRCNKQTNNKKQNKTKTEVSHMKSGNRKTSFPLSLYNKGEVPLEGKITFLSSLSEYDKSSNYTQFYIFYCMSQKRNLYWTQLKVLNIVKIHWHPVHKNLPCTQKLKSTPGVSWEYLPSPQVETGIFFKSLDCSPAIHTLPQCSAVICIRSYSTKN